MKKIIVYCETTKENTLKNVSYELLSKARELKLSAKFIAENSKNINDSKYYIEAVTIGETLDKNSILKAISSGADRVVLLKNKIFNEFVQTTFADCFVKYFDTNPSDVIIFPATTTGRILAPRITTMLETGLVADCTGLEFAIKKDELKLAPTRPTFGAELMATILSKKNPQCATIRPNTFKAEFLEINSIKEGQYVELNVQSKEENRIKLINVIKEPNSSLNDFSGAKVILAGGFGLYTGKNTEYFDKLQKLSKRLNAKFATTRKVVETGLIDKSYQIGQTGATVEADIYIAFGISGAIQHIQGMKNSKKIIAINSDENAEIFKYSDYKIVSDAKKIIDEMLSIV